MTIFNLFLLKNYIHWTLHIFLFQPTFANLFEKAVHMYIVNKFLYSTNNFEWTVLLI